MSKTTSRAGRPTAARVAAINRAILNAARELFLSVGFDAAPMDAVAAAARISKGTLYARYPTKESLLRAVVEAQFAVWNANARSVLPSQSKDFKEQLRARARVIIEALGSEEILRFERLVGGAANPVGKLRRALFDVVYRTAITEMAEDIAKATRRDRVPARRPAMVAEMLMAMIYGWYRTHESVRQVSRREAYAYADRAVDLLFAGRASW